MLFINHNVVIDNMSYDCAISVQEATLNTLVAIEVGCWFFVGEVIGKGHLVGYQIPGAVDFEVHM